MKFNSAAGQEFRTWILFFVGIGLAIIFALNGNPLNPWWTLVIGAFTCTAVIVSAVQAVTGPGVPDGIKKAIKDQSRGEKELSDKEDEGPSLSIKVGPFNFSPIWDVRRCNPITI